MEELVQAIQKGQVETLQELLKLFEPLIYSWLKKTKKLHTPEEEDYYSLAKITLLECALNYQAEKGVPFQSYYKITLWHKTGNIIHKKHHPCISLELFGETEEAKSFTMHDEQREQLEQLQHARLFLTAKECDLLDKILQGYKAKEIAMMYGLKKKTILNRKCLLVKKLKELLQGQVEGEGEEERCFF